MVDFYSSPLRYFTSDRLPDVDPDLIRRLNIIRHFSGVDIKVHRAKTDILNTNGIECPGHEIGKAVDLMSIDPYTNWEIIMSAISAGITRAGIYVNEKGHPRFIHLDVVPNQPGGVLWVNVKNGETPT